MSHTVQHRNSFSVPLMGIFLVFFAIVNSLVLPAFAIKAGAIAGSDFQAGRIIDDVVFYNNNAMNPTQIQQFLNAKVPTCDTNGTQPSHDTTRAAYGTSQGHPPPYTCLKDYSQHVPEVINGGSDLCKSSISAGTKSAAQIIYDAAQACGINPQVLIVLLQKEQSLITDDWPWDTQYRSATGYGCPDTAPCDAEYYGFFNQVYQAAKAFRRYEANPNSFNYKAVRNNFISYNPNADCGGSNVFIHNQATTNLYIYTPYQPNAAALNNLYGTGDGCSAYGNRNFWRMFTDWFGTTYAPSYAWGLVAQNVFTNSSKTIPAGTANLMPNDRVYMQIKIKNNGNQTWSSSGPNPMRIGTIRPYERASSFCDTSWLSCSRPATMLEPTVVPGGTATFEFWMKAPLSGAQTSEYFGPVIEGLAWLPDIGLFYNMSSQRAVYSWQMMSQYAYTDQTKTTVKNLGHMQPGEKAYIGFTAKNTGNMPWLNSGENGILAGTIDPYERPSAFSPTSNWLSGTKPTKLSEPTIIPGAVGTFEFWITAPSSIGERNERFNLVANNYAWMNDTGLSFYTNVEPPLYTWQIVSQYAYTDATKTTPKNLANLTPGETAYIGFTAKNTGNQTWKNTGPNSIMAGTISPQERTTPFAYTGSAWPSGTRPALMKESSVAPGGTATFEFPIKAPMTPGVINERFGIIANGITWMNDTGLCYYAKIN